MIGRCCAFDSDDRPTFKELKQELVRLRYSAQSVGGGGGRSAARAVLAMQPPTSSTADEFATSFDMMDLKEELLRGVYAYALETPSYIQQRAIKPMLMGRDVVAFASPGRIQLHLRVQKTYIMMLLKCRNRKNLYIWYCYSSEA
jgi:hypothetical protein